MINIKVLFAPQKLSGLTGLAGYGPKFCVRQSILGRYVMYEILIQIPFRNDSQRLNLITKVRKGFSVHNISILEWLKWQNWFIQQRRRSVLKRVGAYLPISHTHIFTVQNTLCVVRWHKQSSPWSNASVIELWQCITWQLFRWSCFIALLR